MTIDELIQKYQLRKGDATDKTCDVYLHPQAKQWIIRHHVLQSIFAIEGLVFPAPDQIWSGDGWHRQLQRCFEVGGQEKGWAIGEADRKNCGIGYFGVMATYRGIALAGKQAMGWGNVVYSEHEADWDNDARRQTPRQTPRRAPARPASGGGYRGESKFPPAPWATVEDARKSVMNGDPPAFDMATMERFPFKRGRFEGLTWLGAYQEKWVEDGDKSFLDWMIGQDEEAWAAAGNNYSDFMKKKLHTLMWLRCRVNPETAEELPEEQWDIPEHWTE